MTERFVMGDPPSTAMRTVYKAAAARVGRLPDMGRDRKGCPFCGAPFVHFAPAWSGGWEFRCPNDACGAVVRFDHLYDGNGDAWRQPVGEAGSLYRWNRRECDAL